MTLPDGFRQVDYAGLSVCTLDGAIEQPAVVVAPWESCGELWQACTRHDQFGRERSDPKYRGDFPYWHPLMLPGQTEPATAGTVTGELETRV